MMPVFIVPAYAAEGGGSALPQFNPVYFSSQIFWAIISFSVLLFLLHRYVLPSLRQTLAHRSQQIANELNDAHNHRLAAEKLCKKQQRKLAKARLQAKKIIATAHQKNIREKEDMMQSWTHQMQRERDDFQCQLQQAKAQANKDIHNLAVHIAIAATAKLIAHEVSQEEAKIMVDQVLQDLVNLKKD